MPVGASMPLWQVVSGDMKLEVLICAAIGFLPIFMMLSTSGGNSVPRPGDSVQIPLQHVARLDLCRRLFAAVTMQAVPWPVECAAGQQSQINLQVCGLKTPIASQNGGSRSLYDLNGFWLASMGQLVATKLQRIL